MTADRLRPYQVESVTWLTVNDALNRLLALDPGLGKTAAAITAAHLLAAQNILVVCPAVARIVWDQELLRWWPGPFAPSCLVITPGISLRPAAIPRPGWTIVAYSTLSSRDHAPWLKILAEIDWDVLIIDECQYLKNATNRTRAVYGHAYDRAPGSLTHNAKRVWLLSGTPAPNHAGELYPHLRSLFPDVLPPGVHTDAQFEDRYCLVRDTVHGRRISGSNLQTITELRRRFQPHVLRRRREDVAKDLPPIDFHDTPIAVDARVIDERDWATLAAVDLPADDDDALIRMLRQEEIALGTARRLLGALKVQAAIEFIEDALAARPRQDRKIVVFAWHRTVITALCEGLREHNPVVVEGATTPARRKLAIERFQAAALGEPPVEIFIGQLQAAGTAITLTAAHTAVFVECSWVPAENYQAALRIHRLGQKAPCDVHFLYVPHSLDQRIMHTFRRKAQELAQLM